ACHVAASTAQVGLIQALGGMERSSHIWLTTRLTLVALSIPAWLLIRATMPDDFSQPPKWYIPFILGGFALVSVIAWQVLRNDLVWQRPSWTANPFNQSMPLEGLHLSGWSFVLGALGLLLANFFHQPTDWAWVLPGCIGTGLLVGVRVAATGNAP
ncbi:hypothetical protein LN455_20460, partial [Xanthomonas campestris]